MNILRETILFLTEVLEKKSLILEMTRRDFVQRYIGSFLGLLWAFLEPLAMIAIMWFVFTLGFRTKVAGNVPFVAYLFTGMIPFYFFQDTVGESCGIIRSYAFLVQKVKFRVSILPIIKVNAALILHLVFLIIVILVLSALHIVPSYYWLQIPYYLAAMIFLVLGINWLLSALGVFVKDISYIVAIFLRFIFWLTPIFWNVDMIPARFRWLFKINPMFYIVQGYRESFIYHIPFWHHSGYAIYFWAISVTIFLVGAVVFKRLMPHFADVL
jgi:lipopolysaccharide transport system permease protein